jgi:hypothetical protein
VTVGEFISAFTTKLLDDNVGIDADKAWTEADKYGYLNSALRAFCREAYGIIDPNTVDETLATGAITLTGATGSISKVEVNGVVITSGPVAFDTDLTTTAANLANNINAHTSSPNYTATAALAVVTISAVPGTGSNPNTYAVETTTGAGDLAAANASMSGGNALTRIYIVPGQALYQLDTRIRKVLNARLSSKTSPMAKYDVDQLSSLTYAWESREGVANGYVLDFKDGWLRLDRVPLVADTIELRVQRDPLKRYATTDSADVIELPEDSEDAIMEYMAWRAYMKNDEEAFRPDKANMHKTTWDEMVTDLAARKIRKTYHGGGIRPRLAHT